MSARLAAGVLVSALVRRAQAEGGNAAVLARGDSDAGAIAIVCLERGVFRHVLERAPALEGGSVWRRTGPAEGAADPELAAYFERRRRVDPDLWIVELDVPDVEQLVAGLSGQA